jgi:mannan endo-1,4-beta-mannosidase
MLKRYLAFISILFAATFSSTFAQSRADFVSVNGTSFALKGRPYYFVGANYWYGGLLGLIDDRKKGLERLRRELDFLKSNGVTNLRLMAGAEGTGPISGVIRVGPPLQPEQGKFDERVLEGLDLALAEMKKRDMKAVVFLSNNWEWSGGFQQYLTWNGRVPPEMRTRKLTWDEQRDTVAKFYTCEPCQQAYSKQVAFILDRTNKINKIRYIDDPTIMGWELANEPRPMRPASNDAYRKWISAAAAITRAKDRNHLITTGHEGWIGTEGMELFEGVHSDTNVDYLTIHIWAKNWGWFKGDKLAEDFDNVMSKAVSYVRDHVPVSERLGKPLVIEEFGLPRDGLAFDPAGPTKFRDRYYEKILSLIGDGPGGFGPVAGANFWAFGGTARPIKGQVFWKTGDDHMGDPPMEEQGLNTVFDGDRSTWDVIRAAAKAAKKFRKKP